MDTMSTLCYIEHDGKYLMLHRVVKKNDINKDKWIGIGGHFEHGESPEECLLREVKEETGYDLISYRPRGIITFISGNDDVEYMFLYTADEYEGDPIDCNEGVLEWVDKDEVLRLNIWEGDKIFFRLLADDSPFFFLKLVYEGSGEGEHLAFASLNGKGLELFDIVDEEGRPTGIVRERTVAHSDGSFHRTAHVWIIRKKDGGSFDVLLQKRSEDKDSFPGYYDISSAGHIPAGSGCIESALRELKEELGIITTGDKLHHMGEYRTVDDRIFYGKRFYNREISDSFVYCEPTDIDELNLQKEEIESVMWIDHDEALEMIRSGELKTCINPEEFEDLGSFVSDSL